MDHSNTRDPNALIIVDPSKAPDFDDWNDDDEFYEGVPDDDWFD